jgi:hypothetical protein
LFGFQDPVCLLSKGQKIKKVNFQHGNSDQTGQSGLWAQVLNTGLKPAFEGFGYVKIKIIQNYTTWPV